MQFMSPGVNHPEKKMCLSRVDTAVSDCLARECSTNIYSAQTYFLWFSYFRKGCDHHLAIPTAASPRMVPSHMLLDSLSSRLEAFMMLCPILVTTFQHFGWFHPLERSGVPKSPCWNKSVCSHWLHKASARLLFSKIMFTLLALWV